MAKKTRSNEEIALLLDEIADLLEAGEENPFRVRSYRNAAGSIRATRRPVAELVESDGTEGLREIQGIGEKIAGLIGEYVETGKAEILEDLKKDLPPEAVKKAEEKKAEHAASPRPPISIDLLLAVDEEYRKKAAAGTLRKIAPKQLNPTGEAWLPIMNTSQEGYKFTVMFSNTPRAHETGKTNDWVVVYFRKDGGEEDQYTVVTEQKGPLKGKRVVRGREKECAAYYAQ